MSTELRLRIRPPLPWIAVLGPDGSGKSTVLQEVSELLRTTIPRRRIFHWRPAVIKPGHPEAGPVTDPHGKAPRNLPASLAKLLFLFADWWLGYWTRLVPHSARLTLCLFDRCYVDLLVDSRRYRYGGPMGLARWVGKLLPQPAIILLLDAPPAVLQARKKEVSFEETQRQAGEYRNLVGQLPNGVIINCDRPAAEVAQDVCMQVIRLLRIRQQGHDKG